MISLQCKTLELLLLVVFLTGIFAGKWKERRDSSLNNNNYHQSRQGPQHGRIVNIHDLPDQNTVHVDKEGRPIRKKQLIQPFAIPNLSGFSVATLEAGQTVSQHEHESMHEIFYVVSGQAVFTVDGIDHLASPGTMVHLAPHEKHHILAQESPDGSLVMAYFGVTI